ncbi:phage tail tube protein [Sphingomonas xinjiangensis]|uniref:Putative secreted protein n=1 Tax=Sphingomonas xinjiangensis TaxID=643568 RepID=A0A840YBN5_9SPHN|nr:phage tail tube protein [Sphingomonas xinjiangensis]MBB5709439.1 putative secreted protein [Sphingomonas xinjiangensis]
MASNAVKTKNTKLEIETGADTWVQVKGLTNFSGLGSGSAAVIDTTDFDSTAKEKEMGLLDEGQVSIDLMYLPKDAGQLALKAARGTQAKTGVRITLSDGTKFEFDAFVLTFEKSGELDAVVEATATLEVTGGVTETAGA